MFFRNKRLRYKLFLEKVDLRDDSKVYNDEKCLALAG